MKHAVIYPAALVVAALVSTPVAADPGGVAAAVGAFLTGQAAGLGPTQTGQPGASCEDDPNPPGGSASAPGSAFNPDGKSGTVYAGEQPQNSVNSASVSQYDVACVRPTF